MRPLTRTAAMVVAGISVAHFIRRLVRGPALKFPGKVVLITGSSRGLGLVLAREFAKRGCRIVICSRDSVQLERARHDLEARGAEVFAERCDVANPDEVRGLIAAADARFGGVDIVVNNAGVIQVGPFDTMREADFERAMAINFWGAFNVISEVLPQMRARRAGRIVNITSIGGKLAVPHLLPYSASKFAMVGYSQGLSAELAKEGIRVSTIVPGLMRTGSPVNALFKGQAELEFTWFSLGDALPFTSISAERAARRIVKAARRGEAEVTLSWQAKLLRITHGLLPGTVTRILGWLNRLLPEANGIGKEEQRGMELTTSLAPSRLTWLMNRAAKRNLEYQGVPEPSREHGERVGVEDL